MDQRAINKLQLLLLLALLTHSATAITPFPQPSSGSSHNDNQKQQLEGAKPQQSEIEKRRQGAPQLSDREELGLNEMDKFRYEQNLGCSIECLECKENDCVRYNWIGVICLGLLLVNFAALAYCIWLTKKIRGKSQGSSQKASIISHDGSISRSIAQFD